MNGNTTNLLDLDAHTLFNVMQTVWVRDIPLETRVQFDSLFWSDEEKEKKRIDEIASREDIPDELKGRYVPEWWSDDDEDVTAGYKQLQRNF